MPFNAHWVSRFLDYAKRNEFSTLEYQEAADLSTWLRSILEKCIACSRDVQVPFLPLAHVSFHLIFQLNPWYSEAFAKVSGKGVVIVPLTGLQVEGVAADHVGNGL